MHVWMNPEQLAKRKNCIFFNDFYFITKAIIPLQKSDTMNVSM